MSAAPPSRMTAVPPIDTARPPSNFPTASSCSLDCQPRSNNASSHNPLAPPSTGAVAPPFSTPPARLDKQLRDPAEPPSPTDKGHRAQHEPLRIATDFHQNASSTSVAAQQDLLSVNKKNNASVPPARTLRNRSLTTNLHPPSRTPSVRSALATTIARSVSSVSSPVITALGDMTPLPSPLLSADSPSPWTNLIDRATPPPPSDAREHHRAEASYSPPHHPTAAVRPTVASPPGRKSYANLDQVDNALALGPVAQPQHRRHASQSTQDHRSVSAYQPDPAAAAAPKRPATVSASHAKVDVPDACDSRLRREINYARSRGLLAMDAQPPSPRPSESSKGQREGDHPPIDRASVFFDAYARADGKKRRWRVIRFLEQGTFSRVMLATSQLVPSSGEPSDASNPSAAAAAAIATPASPVDEDSLHRKKLVTVKVCEHGPRGGASEDRVEMSLKRELEIMQIVHHPSIVNLKAWNVEPTGAVLVLSYYPGGDLFGVAREHRSLLTQALTRRIFAELVGAVRYLHHTGVVHRDIKLENVLVNLTPAELANLDADWSTFRHSVVALADLGLARRVGPNEKLETRCGSDDYAAPEVIMGQPYDGRATDAWSLGVLLYALLEARLPFDPHPAMSEAHRMRSRTSHRIARVEWRWVDFAGDDGHHDASTARFRDKGLLGAMEITEGLLRRARTRWTMDHVAAQPWVRDALPIHGGLCFWEEEQGEEV